MRCLTEQMRKNRRDRLFHAGARAFREGKASDGSDAGGERLGSMEWHLWRRGYETARIRFRTGL